MRISPVNWRLVIVLTLGFVVAGLAGCGKRKTEYNGIGKWVINKTTLKEWGYANMCQAEGELTWCQAHSLEKSHTVSLGGQNGLVGTYYKGNQPESVLVEIVIDVSSCDAESLKSWLKSHFGSPSASKDNLLHWSGKHVFISAKAPSSGAACMVNFVAADDKKRIEELKAGK